MKCISRHLLGLTLLLCPLAALAQSFTYNYRGIDFDCKVKNGRTIIRGFDTKANKVVIPAKVTDSKSGREYQVSVIDLYAEAMIYKTSMVAIEKGVLEIENRSFQNFRNLSSIYIPASVERIGQKAFNSKHLPTFNMPNTISQNDLAAGRAIHPQVEKDIMADFDYSDYTDEPAQPKNKTIAKVEQTVKKVTPGTSDIDYNIPLSSVNRENTFCLIIANENYQKQNTPEVAYAATDGQTFQKYCTNTLGIPRENIKMMTDATYLEMKDMFSWLNNVAEEYGNDANYIVYYAGHGVPDAWGNCYLLPVDGDINKPGTNGYSLKTLYNTLGQITTKSALVLIDACFSGSDRDDVSMVDGTERGFVREIKNETVTGNVVVLTAASNTETALAYNEKGHGMFSYFLMKKLQETKGNVTYGELFDYINQQVRRRSTVVMSKRQTPSATCSDNIRDTWKQMKF